MEQGTTARAARFSDRFVAYLLDVVPFAAGAAATTWALLGPLAKAPTPELLALVVASWVTLLFGYQLAGNVAGGTVGKRLMGLRLVARDGGPPGFLRALVRAAVWLIGTPLASFGFLVALFNRENRALHDYASGTVVVESYRKSPAEGALLFLAGAAAALALFGFQIFSGWARPTPRDLAAVVKAKDGLAVIARVQEAYKEKNGTYATSIEELAQASGDAEEFKAAAAAIFRPDPFQMEAGNRGWRIRVAARDRRGTIVVRDGP
ncbi:MAG: RDD family protein [Elusimicrobia bacterium]|nr:RDD family protein [Elusimicrobiota bacterium]